MYQKKRSIFAQNFVRRNEKKIIYIACEFLKPLASNIKSWIVSKKFSLQEFTDLLGTGNGPGQRESITVKKHSLSQRIASAVRFL